MPSLGFFARAFAATLTAFLVPATAAPVLSASAVDCTVVGTAGPDRLVGTAGDDVICGKGGNDVMLGRGGDDRMLSGPGADRLLGGSGDDVLLGGRGDDFLEGGTGADSFKGGAGFDTLSYAGRTQGIIADPFGRWDDGAPGEGDDIWRASINRINGGDGADRLNLPSVGGVVHGGGGDDILRSRQGGGTLIGGAGADRLLGSLDEERMIGGIGSDVLLGRSGRDWIDGGRGQDWCDLDPADQVRSCGQAPAPEVHRVSVDQPNAEPGDTVTVTVDLSAPAWVTEAWVHWRSDRPAAPAICQEPPQLISGNLRSGTWAQTCAIPEEAENGEYLLVASAGDTMGTWNDDATPPSATVEIAGSFYDRIGPAVDAVIVHPTAASPGETVSVTGHLADRDGVKTAWAEIHLVDDRFAGHVIEQMELVSGTDHDGTWTQSLKVPVDAPDGSYLVRVSGMDMLGYGTVPDAPGNFSNLGLIVSR